MSYAERAFFDGDHCAHVVARDERDRLRMIARHYRVASLRDPRFKARTAA